MEELIQCERDIIKVYVQIARVIANARDEQGYAYLSFMHDKTGTYELSQLGMRRA